MAKKHFAKKNETKKPKARFAPWLLRAMMLLCIWGRDWSARGCFVFLPLICPALISPKIWGRRPSLTILARDGSVLVRTGQGAR